MTPRSTFLIAALGAAAMFFLDPQSGRRRRAVTRDKAVHGIAKTRDMLHIGGRDLKHRTLGTVRSVSSLFDRSATPDEVLAQRVRAKLGRYVSHPRSVTVHASDGKVALSGVVLEHERDRLLGAARMVRGVRAIDDQLIAYAKSEGISALQGGSARRGEHANVFRDNWAPGTRMVGGVTALLLGALALRRSGVRRVLWSGLSAALMSRSARRPVHRADFERSGRNTL